MQNLNTHSTLFKKNTESKPKVAMFFVYVVLGLSLCVFGASVWFSSYAKKVYIGRRPLFEREVGKIQNEIHKLELDVNTLTDVKRVRSLIKELELVEPTKKKSIELQDR